MYESDFYKLISLENPLFQRHFAALEFFSDLISRNTLYILLENRLEDGFGNFTDLTRTLYVPINVFHQTKG